MFQERAFAARACSAVNQWRHRIDTHVALAVIAITSLSLLCSVVTANHVFAQHSLQDSQGALRATASAFQTIVRNRLDLMAARTRAFADVPAFKATMDLKDRPTLQAMAQAYRQSLQADFCVVTDKAGIVMASPGYAGPPPRTSLRGIDHALRGKSYAEVVPLTGHLFQVVSEPGLLAGVDVEGTLTTGYELNDKPASELAKMTQCQVNFVVDGVLRGSSLDEAQRQALKNILRTRPNYLGAVGGMPQLRSLGTLSYVCGAYAIPLAAPNSGAYLLLLRDWQPTAAVLHQVRSVLTLAALAVMVLAICAGVLFSRRLSRPLRDIADAAAEIGGGNWSRRVPIRGSAEAATMAAAFNQMTDSVSHWYNEAVSEAKRSDEALVQLRDSYTATLQALSRALDARDNETEGHSIRVTSYALKLADALGIDPESRSRLELGALLHDIGKIGIPDAILRKPGRLTDEEMAVMKEHCAFGMNIIQGIPHLEAASVVIGSHHERWDGEGYPARLKGRNIPTEARLFMICDTLDAITSDRPYRRGRSFEEAIAEIHRCRGSQFDPELVDVAVRIFSRMKCRARQEFS